MENELYIIELINKYGIYEDQSIKDAIEQVEYKQASLVSDGQEEYKELESIKIYLYKLYIQDYEQELIKKKEKELQDLENSLQNIKELKKEINKINSKGDE